MTKWKKIHCAHTMEYHYKGMYDTYPFTDIDVKDSIVRQEFHLIQLGVGRLSTTDINIAK